jgi:SAM-dependent methyltransferase
MGEAAMSQDQVFLTGEADQWFVRNRDALERADRFDWPLHILDGLEGRDGISSFLELGCSNGWRLARLRERFGEGKRYVGVDPSAEAVGKGMEMHPGIELHRGVLADVPLKGKFPFVLVHYVLHWVERSTLMRSLAEIDRLVADGGYLLVGDFLPDYPQQVPYHHLPGQEVFTYKQDYAGVFRSLGLYSEILRVTHGHGRNDGDFAFIPSRDRGICTLLRKSSAGFYAGGGT